MSFRDQGDVKDGTWGAILCVDPNGLRPVGTPGPYYYLLDHGIIRPGLTDKSGVFIGLINDNKTPSPWARTYDMMLLTPDSDYIKDNDEFWIGVKEDAAGSINWLMGGWITDRFYNLSSDTRITGFVQGDCYMDLLRDSPFATPDSPRNYKGYPVDFIQVVQSLFDEINAIQIANYQITKHAVWFPHSETVDVDVNYTDTTIQLDSVAYLTTGLAMVWDDNAPHDASGLSYWGEYITITAVNPGLKTIDFTGTPIRNLNGYNVADNARVIMASSLSGVRWDVDFNVQDAFAILRDGCIEAGWEWQIVPDSTGVTPADTRVLMLYERSAGPEVPSPRIAYDLNIRSIPMMQMGDTSELITELSVVGSEETVPPARSDWTTPGAWMDINSGSRKYTMFSIPFPPNSSGLGQSSQTGTLTADPRYNEGYCEPSGAWTYGNRLSDRSLVIDNDGFPAVNFQKHGEENNLFHLGLAIYIDNDERPIGPGLGLSLREWRRLKFNFRHGSRSRNLTLRDYLGDWWLDYDKGSVYKISLHTNITSPQHHRDDWLNRAFEYEFGKNRQSRFQDEFHERYDRRPRYRLHGVDTVVNALWNKLDLLLPEIDDEGNVIEWNGWEAIYTQHPSSDYDTADPRQIDFITFYIDCAEDEPGVIYSDYREDHGVGGVHTHQGRENEKYIARIPLGDDTVSGGGGWDQPTDPFIYTYRIYKGDTSLRCPVPEAWFYRGIYYNDPFTGEIVFTHPRPRIMIADELGTRNEILEIAAVGGEYGPYGTDNVKLASPVQQGSYVSWTYDTTNEWWFQTWLYIIGGRSVSLSQVHFAKDHTTDIQADLPANLQSPRRTRFTYYPQAETQKESEALANKELMELSQSPALVQVIIDGDPDMKPGWIVNPQLDPGKGNIYHQVSMLIDDAEYVVEGTDFYCILTLSMVESKSQRTDRISNQARQGERIRRIEVGRRKPRFQESVP